MKARMATLAPPKRLEPAKFADKDLRALRTTSGTYKTQRTIPKPGKCGAARTARVRWDGRMPSGGISGLCIQGKKFSSLKASLETSFPRVRRNLLSNAWDTGKCSRGGNQGRTRVGTASNVFNFVLYLLIPSNLYTSTLSPIVSTIFYRHLALALVSFKC